MVILYIRYYIAVIAGGNFNNALSDGLFTFTMSNAVGNVNTNNGVCAIKSTI